LIGTVVLANAIAAATIAAAVARTVAVDAPTAVEVARNTAAADVPGSVLNAVPADPAVRATIAAMAITLARPAARNSSPKCSRPVRT